MTKHSGRVSFLKMAMHNPYRKRWRMTRKDEKETDRPHYYSQFWLDVAAGRREIGASRSEESAEEDDLPESIPSRRSSHAAASAVLDGNRNARPRDLDAERFAASEPEDTDEPENFSETEEDELAGGLDEENTPDFLFGDTTDEASEEVAEDEPALDDEDLEDEEYFDEEDEEEDEDGWSSRGGRKKPKPGRQAKAPKQTPKKPKRGGRSY